MLLWAVYGVCFGVGALVLLVHLVVAAGVLRNLARDRRIVAPGHPRWSPAPSGALAGDHAVRAPGPRVSVVVASKDEEAVLPGLFASLEAQTYRDFEIVLVDDRSADGTGVAMAAFRERSSRPVKLIRNDQEPRGVTGKVQALDLAVAAASGDVLVFTDSDCTLPPGWVAGHLAYYSDPELGVVFGTVGMAPSASFLDSYQAFDQRLIHQYSSGSAGVGLPTGCFGNNLSARRGAIEAVGGFRGLGYTVTEDAALIAAVGKRRRWKVLASSLADLGITTRPQLRWRDFLNQHTRWNIGGFYSSDCATRSGYRLLVLYLTGSVLVLPLAAAAPLLWLLTLNAFVCIGLLAVLDATVVPGRSRRDRLLAVPYTLFFMLFYALVTIRAVLRRKPEWKGARLDVRP
jgi:cellulose synthase/poly-beta-1,6-N-acetylglucosamine synthase-like glycosyltransferase